VERILNKRKVRGKDKYLVCWKGFTAESDTWEGRENLENTKETIEEFEKEYWRDIEDIVQQEREEGTFRWRELLGRFMTKKLYEWSDKQYDQEYWGRMEKNWRQWKGKKPTKRETIKTILEEKEIEEEKSGVREWTKEDNDEIGNMIDLCYEL